MTETNIILERLTQWFSIPGMSDGMQRLSATLVTLSLALAVAALVYYLCARVAAPFVLRLVARTKVTWDDLLLNPQVVKALSRLVVVIALSMMLPDACDYYPGLRAWTGVIMRVLVVMFVVLLVNRLIMAVYDIVCSHTNAPARSLTGLREMLQIIVVCIGLIIAVSILVNRSPLIILSGLGASAAVLMLVFKDSILGLVSGVRLTMNDMLRPGDWITAPRYGANGTVLEVTLTTVKVQNFDMTIVTIPPYSLVSDSFQNWRGMQDSSGRRVMRSLNIDANSVRFVEPEALARYAGEEWTADLDLSRRQVNLAVFRRYLEHEIRKASVSVPSMTSMVRELQPTPQGIPVEIYFFTPRQEWVSYEHVQADLLDFVVATLPEFGLRVYQAPSGLDVLSLKGGSVVAE